MTARALHAVRAGERDRGGRPQNVATAARTGDRRRLLVALRARISKTVDDPNTPPRDLAALSRRLLEIAKEIEAIDADGGGDEVSEAAETPDEEWAAT